LTLEEYKDHIDFVLESCPDAKPEDIASELARYENEFKIPAQDAVHSVIRKFKTNADVPVSKSSGSTSRTSAPQKKVEKLDELKGDDKNVVIEVKIISNFSRESTIRGELRTTAYGLLEDKPFDENSTSTRWEYKDWGPNKNVKQGSIVRLEGVSVNEYNEKLSLNINQNCNVVVLKEGVDTSVEPGEPVDIAKLPSDGPACVVGRILAMRDDQIHRKDGSGSIDVVRGKIADSSGTISFLSWEPMSVEIGQLVKIDNATVKSFRDTPEINIGRATRVEPYHDASFSGVEELEQMNQMDISRLSDGSRDVNITVEIHEWEKRTFTRDGVEKYLWSGKIADNTGQCRMSAWQDLPISEDDLPVCVKLSGVRVRAWQGIPDITVDRADQVEVLADTPWEEKVDLSNQEIEISVSELARGSGRIGVKTQGVFVSIRDDSGVIMRCPECRRTLKDGVCSIHGAVEGNQDIRLRFVIDDGAGNVSVILNSECTQMLLGMNEKGIQARVEEMGDDGFVSDLRRQFFAKMLSVSGRFLKDENGSMFIADKVSLVEEDAVMMAAEVRNTWGLN
tara:strand:- start:23591 stop:25285 length:1695 start_codon:yes stop_codon:yes gene_type:complete